MFVADVRNVVDAVEVRPSPAVVEIRAEAAYRNEGRAVAGGEAGGQHGTAPLDRGDIVRMLGIHHVRNLCRSMLGKGDARKWTVQIQ